MKAIRKVKKGTGVLLQEIPIPCISENQLLVKILASALCKSDLDVFYFTESFHQSGVPLPFTMGHEFCGEVVKVGKAVKGFKPGDHVCGETHVPCRTCAACQSGYQHICPHMGLIGRTVDGCFAEYMALPAVSAVKIPKEIPAEQAALFEPFGVAVHALQEAQVDGKAVMITGTGTIGSMAVEAARAMGAGKIIVTSRDDQKLERARELGADHGINIKKDNIRNETEKYTRGAGVDCVIEMTGKDTVFNDALDALRPGGKIICVGNHNQPMVIQNFTGRVMYREITVTGIFGRRLFDTWDIAVQLACSGKVDLKRYIGRRTKLEYFDKAAGDFEKVSGRIVFR